MMKGIDLELGGKVHTVPPLSMGAIERHQDKLAAPTATDIIDIATDALKRNYPDYTREIVAELVDVANCQELFEVVMNVSGLKPKAGASGEAKARARR